MNQKLFKSRFINRVYMEEKYCNNCGSKLTENENYCPNCGAKVPVYDNEQQVVICSKCQERVRDNVKFCPRCGAYLNVYSDYSNDNFYQEKNYNSTRAMYEAGLNDDKVSILWLILPILVPLSGYIACIVFFSQKKVKKGFATLAAAVIGTVINAIILKNNPTL